MDDALSALLAPFERDLLSVGRRRFILEALEADLVKVARGELFRVRNDVLQLMFTDTLGTLAVHLASWARAVYQPGGLIDGLCTKHAHDLPSKRPPGPLEGDPSWRASRDREHADALNRLFPGMSEGYPNDWQFNQLRDTFVARMKPVVDDASSRVRPYDQDSPSRRAQRLEFSEIRDAVSSAERLMNDLSMVGCQREHAYREMNTPHAADVIPDMVDAFLLGPPDQVERVRGELDRLAFYDELHHRHSLRPKRASRFFNDTMFSRSTTVKAAGRPVHSEPRYVGFFPALPLDENLELGEWVVGTPPDGTPWVSRRFRDLSESLVRSFGKLGFSGGAMLWHRDRGFDGSKPSENLIKAIHAAVTFAVLDANDRLRLTEPDEGDTRWDMATTENADLFIQPIDEDGGITHSQGGALKSTLVGGHKIGGQPPPLSDAVQSIRRPVPVSQKLARAVFEAVRIRYYDPVPAVAVAIEWHRTALANPPAVTMEQRLIALKTGFEALFSTSSSAEGARKLRALFKSTTQPHRDLLPWSGLLWTPNERDNLWRWFWMPNGLRQLERRDEIEDWFKTLADVRNDVIHRGSLTSEMYRPPPERPLSRYVGHLLWVGERVLREAIKAKLGVDVLLCGALARRTWAKATFGDVAREFAKKARAAAKAGTLAPPPEAHPPRPLPEILSYLQVDSAKYVVVGPVRLGGNGYSDQASAHRGRITMSITGSEFLALRAAGAEDEVRHFWDPCP